MINFFKLFYCFLHTFKETVSVLIYFHNSAFEIEYMPIFQKFRWGFRYKSAFGVVATAAIKCLYLVPTFGTMIQTRLTCFNKISPS